MSNGNVFDKWTRKQQLARLKDHTLLGTSELADVLGISTALVSVWAQRNKLPKPDYHIRAGSFWYKRTIEKWLRDEHV